MDMELHLARPDAQQTQVAVTCDDAFSHTFDLHTIIPTRTNGLSHPRTDPVTDGKALYAALFAPGSPEIETIAERTSRPRRSRSVTRTLKCLLFFARTS